MKIYSIPSFSSYIYSSCYLALIKYVAYHTNKFEKQGRILAPIGMMTICGCSRSTIFRFLQECKDKNIIQHNEKERAYILNPHYAIKGNGVYDWVWEMFGGKEG